MESTQFVQPEISAVNSVRIYSDSEYRLLFSILTTDSYLLNATNDENPLSTRSVKTKGCDDGCQSGAQKLWTSVFVYPQFIIL